MQGAVFSDVEGTLVDASLPTMALTIGREVFKLSPARRVQLKVLATVERTLPQKLRRTMQLVRVLVAMSGQTAAEVETLNARFIPQVMQSIKPVTLERLRGHQDAGLSLVLVSAGFHESIAALGAELGGRGEGTRLRQQDGRYLGRVDGKVCQGQNKAARATAVILEMGYDPTQSYAYGDTASDIPFLKLFGHPQAVDPDAVLTAHAQQKGWPIIRTKA